MGQENKMSQQGGQQGGQQQQGTPKPGQQQQQQGTPKPGQGGQQQQGGGSSTPQR
jgi:hypothetical protein